MKKCQKLLFWNYFLFLTQFPANLAALRSQTLPSILVCLLLLLFHRAKEGVEKTGKIETEKDYNYFLKSANGDFFLDNFPAAKAGFLMGFASILGEQAAPLQKSGRILIFTHLRRKITEMFHMDAGETTFLWLLLSLVVVTCWMFTVFCWLRWPKTQIQTLASKCFLSGARQLPPLHFIYLNNSCVLSMLLLLHFFAGANGILAAFFKLNNEAITAFLPFPCQKKSRWKTKTWFLADDFPFSCSL